MYSCGWLLLGALLGGLLTTHYLPESWELSGALGVIFFVAYYVVIFAWEWLKVKCNKEAVDKFWDELRQRLEESEKPKEASEDLIF